MLPPADGTAAMAAGPSTSTSTSPSYAPSAAAVTAAASRAARAPKRPVNVLSAEYGSGISSSTWARPPFSAPAHSAAPSASASVSASVSSGWPLPGSSSASSAAPSHAQGGASASSVPSTAAHAPEPTPSQPQFRTSAATAQRKLVAAQRARLSALSRNLTTRLQYACFKVDNGWATQSVSEVENLYYRSVVANRSKERQPQTRGTSGSGTGAGTGTGTADGSPPSAQASEANRRIADSGSLSTAGTKRKEREPANDGSPTLSISPSQQRRRAPSSALLNSQTGAHLSASGSPPSKRAKSGQAQGGHDLLTSHPAAINGDAAGAGSASTNGPASSGLVLPKQTAASPLKLSTASLGGHKQDLFTAHGLVTPPSFLTTALFPKEGGGNQAGSAHRVAGSADGLTSSTKAGPASTNAQANGPSPIIQPTPPMSDPTVSPPLDKGVPASNSRVRSSPPPASPSARDERRRQGGGTPAGSDTQMKTPTLPSSARTRPLGGVADAQEQQRQLGHLAQTQAYSQGQSTPTIGSNSRPKAHVLAPPSSLTPASIAMPLTTSGVAAPSPSSSTLPPSAAGVGAGPTATDNLATMSDYQLRHQPSQHDMPLYAAAQAQAQAQAQVGMAPQGADTTSALPTSTWASASGAAPLGP